MTAELPLRCACGAIHGVAQGVGRSHGVRLRCYCRDCQTYARFLGRPSELLDQHGGTEVFQLSPARVRLEGELGKLACVRLREGGLMRWYAACCRTPIGNTLSRPRVPFVGLVSACWDPQLDAAGRDERLGPLQARVNGPGHADERGTMPAIDRVPLGAMLHSLRVLGAAWVRGEHRPSPFFDDEGKPRVTPHVLPSDELAALREQLPNPPRR